MNAVAFPLAAAEVIRTRFEFGRLQSLPDWMTFPVAVALVCMAMAAILVFVVWLYLRDTRELGNFRAFVLIVLRAAAFFGLLALWMEPRWRTEREIVHNSRAVVLVDASVSMGLSDADAPDAGAGSRASHVIAAAERTGFFNQLRKTHDVVVFRFDDALHRVASLSKAVPTEDESGSDEGQEPAPEDASESEVSTPAEPQTTLDERIDWPSELRPGGKSTRLGESLRQAITDQRGEPLSGIVLITDGGQNAGPSPDPAIELAREAKIPVYSVGVGSSSQPVNVRVYELEAPERANPGDPYSVAGLIQAQGLAGRTVTVQLFVLDPAKKTEQRAGSQDVTLGGDGEAVQVKFQLTPTETGRRKLSMRILAPQADRQPEDNRRDTEIEIVDRKNRVLLFAGGPSREYQFLRSLLYRDKSTVVDVLLQSGSSGISQEGNQILEKFPETREELFAYDCIVAFDPRWQSLTPAQVELLDAWVAEQGGGMILIAGPIFASQAIGGWVQDAKMAKIRALYPVEFQRQFTVMDREQYVAKEAWPLEFTREGREAEFLWLADTESENLAAWASFLGVFSCQPLRGPKPGAAVYAKFSDPRAAQGNQQPIYFAGQFYGSGRTFYLGSGEMWRLRRADEGYFEQFYTRLVRHASQGRLLRQSSRGTLIVDKDRYLLGNTAEIRAHLTNARLQPLTAPNAALEALLPDGKIQTITLRPDPQRPGLYAGQLTLLQEGEYRLELPVPESDNERLTRRLQVRLPDLERENPQRNDALLSRIAVGTGGKFYTRLDAAMDPAAADGVAMMLKDRTKTSILTEAPNLLWEEVWLQWMMFALCGVLCLEWLIRRLSKLA